MFTRCSLVDIAQRPRRRFHQIRHDYGRASSVANVNRGAKRGVGGRGRVEKGACAGDAGLADACGAVELLPDPPDAVDHAVVEVEEGIAGGGEEIATGVSA